MPGYTERWEDDTDIRNKKTAYLLCVRTALARFLWSVVSAWRNLSAMWWLYVSGVGGEERGVLAPCEDSCR